MLYNLPNNINLLLLAVDLIWDEHKDRCIPFPMFVVSNMLKLFNTTFMGIFMCLRCSLELCKKNNHITLYVQFRTVK